MKTRIEEAAVIHSTQMRGEDFSDVSNNVNFELMKQSFIAGAEFMKGENEKLKAQNDVMIDALKDAYSYLENSEHCKHADKAYYIVDNAIEALKKIGEV